jgi:predicted O-methyltransferase YrrM
LRETIEQPIQQQTLAFRNFRQALFGLYDRRGAQLEQKEMPWSLGTTWGYWLASWQDRRAVGIACAASIGEDEVRLFHDLCELAEPTSALVIGHSFGLSTFCIALAAPTAKVVALDNWSDADSRSLARPLSESIQAEDDLAHVHVHEGESPRDIAPALRAGNLEGSLDLAFIDGLHTDAAAAADFQGLLPHLTARSVVLWHNVHQTSRAFEDGAGGEAARLFNVRSVLRTHGPLGIYYSSEEHPLLSEYLRSGSLFWPEWKRYVHLTSHERELHRFEELRSTTGWKLVARLARTIRRGVRRRR